MAEERDDRALGALLVTQNLDEARATLAKTGTALLLADHRTQPFPERGGSGARRDGARLILAGFLACSPQDVPLGQDETGAPRLKMQDAPYCLSFAGRAGWSLVGISRCAIGVDLEQAILAAKIPYNLLRPEERADLAALDPAEASAYFLRLWTIKEAIGKALKRGLFLAPERIRLRFSGRDVVASIDDAPQALQSAKIAYRALKLSEQSDGALIHQFGLASVTL
jgi:phosphopantetheinyl transferase (holo-ACP synthase)